ncbi:hypothetical protein [Pseudomonas grimontii]|uniref:hypothetical protein n=1 Tax=Pseudomonas grimontii TaxID=129847 RepID=UPI00387B778F
MQSIISELPKRLRQLSLPVPDHLSLEELVHTDGDYLDRTLALAERHDGGALASLQGIFFNLIPSVSERLIALDLHPLEMSALVQIGKVEGPRFAKALKAVQVQCPQRKEMIEYISAVYQSAALPHSSAQCPQDNACSTNVYADPAQPAVDVETEREFLTYHVYGGKVAACFSGDTTRNKHSTVRIEAAECIESRKFNWGDKIAIQVSMRELPQLLATLMRYQQSFTGKGHGENNEKWFTVENQPGKVFLSVHSKGRAARALPVLPGDIFNITAIILGQMMKNTPHLSCDNLLTLIKLQFSDPISKKVD